MKPIKRYSTHGLIQESAKGDLCLYIDVAKLEQRIRLMQAVIDEVEQSKFIAAHPTECMSVLIEIANFIDFEAENEKD